MKEDIKIKLEEDKKLLLENQICLIADNNLLNEVITLQEASEILDCADSTLRTQVLKGKYKNGLEYRKAKGTILFSRSVIENIKTQMNKK